MPLVAIRDLTEAQARAWVSGRDPKEVHWPEDGPTTPDAPPTERSDA